MFLNLKVVSHMPLIMDHHLGSSFTIKRRVFKNRLPLLYISPSPSSLTPYLPTIVFLLPIDDFLALIYFNAVSGPYIQSTYKDSV